MKKIIFTLLAVSALFAGCQKSDINVADGVGTVTFNVTNDESLHVATRAFALPEADPNTFSIEIKSADGAIVKQYPTLAEVPAVLELPGGQYTATAKSPNPKKVGWDNPVYEGVKNFGVVVGKASNVELVCKLANMVVTINPTEKFMAEITEFDVTVQTEDSTLVWSREDVQAGKAGYFAPKKLSVYVTGRRHNGEDIAQVTKEITNVAPQDHHIINLDAKVTGTMGGLNVTINPEVNDKEENVQIPGADFKPIPDEPNPDQGGEEPLPPSTAPKITWNENPTFEPYELAETMNVELTVEAQEKIKSFVVKVETPLPAFLGILEGMVSPENAHVSEGYVNLDLIDDQNAVTNLSDPEIGLPVGDQLTGKTSVPFSLSNLLPLILQFQPESGSIHTFTLSVTDEKGQTFTQPVPFKVK